eukprot:Gb_03745 [translate_table: standard]
MLRSTAQKMFSVVYFIHCPINIVEIGAMEGPWSHGGSLLVEDFGQKVDLTRRIREVLSNYPEGTTVLKETIQNADDAGATKVSFCLDRRVHGGQSLLCEQLREWQGPALLAYNNSQFTEEDFVSISRIGDSKKRGQAWKTGRFGYNQLMNYLILFATTHRLLCKIFVMKFTLA